MATVKMGFIKLTIPEQIERTRLIITMMTGNANFPISSPTLPVMSAAATALETAYNEARNRDKIKVAAMNARRKNCFNWCWHWQVLCSRQQKAMRSKY